MSRSGSLYIEKSSLFHRLDGSVKLVMLLSWTIFLFFFMDLRIFTGMIVLGGVLLSASKIPFKNMKPLIGFVVVFTFFNSAFLMLVTPEYGSVLSGTRTVLWTFYGRVLTYETMFFALTLSLKYLGILPITLLFIFTTHPSRFASSLSKAGANYKIAYAVSIALRYIPNVLDDLMSIKTAQEARGVAFSGRDAGLRERISNYLTVLVPLLMSSLNRIEVVSNAMDLRGFGTQKKRTWYHYKSYTKVDLLFLSASILLVAIGILLKSKGLDAFWYPFA